jgi:hypothetical protein
VASTLADTLAAQSRRPGFACAIGTYLSTLDDDARADVLGAFRDERVSSGVLADWLDGQGVTVQPNNVVHHRNGRCAGCRAAGIDYRVAS